MKFPLLPLRDGAFHIDSTGLAAIMRCPRYAWHLLWHRRESNAFDDALNFGRILHMAWEYRYRHYGNKQLPMDAQAAQEALLENWFSQVQMPPDEWRNLGRAKETMALYNKEYADEPFEVLRVEQPFAMEIGHLQILDSQGFLQQRVPLIYDGKMDLIVRVDKKLAVLDFKHSQYSDTDKELAKYEMSPQMLGYCAGAAHVMGEPCNDAIVRFAIVRKPSASSRATLPRNEFPQHEFRYSQAKIDAWRSDTVRIVQNWLRQCADAPPPMHRTSCAWPKRCQFFDVCTLATLESQMSWLSSSAYKDYVWSPLNTAEQNGEA